MAEELSLEPVGAGGFPRTEVRRGRVTALHASGLAFRYQAWKILYRVCIGGDWYFFRRGDCDGAMLEVLEKVLERESVTFYVERRHPQPRLL